MEKENLEMKERIAMDKEKLESISDKNPQAFWDLINKFKVNATDDSEGSVTRLPGKPILRL